MSSFACRLQTVVVSVFSHTPTTLPAPTINSYEELPVGGVATRLSGINAYDRFITDNVTGQSGTTNLSSYNQANDSSVSDHTDGYQLYLDTSHSSEQTADKTVLAPIPAPASIIYNLPVPSPVTNSPAGRKEVFR